MENQKLLAELNEKRKNVLKHMLWGMLVCVLGVFFMLGSPVIGILLIIAGFFISNRIRKSSGYEAEYKELLVKGVFEKYFDDVTIESDGFDYDFVEESKLIPCGNTYNSDDLISGSYHGVRFMRSDVCMQQVTSNGKTTTTTTYFHGPWMVFDFPKKFASYLCVKEKSFSGGNPGGWFGSIDKFKMENVAFNKRFNTYGSSQHDTFYILTPHFMEQIMAIDDRFEGDLCLGFIDNRVHVLLDNGENAFEPPLFSSVTEADIHEIDTQVKMICKIMDYLKLIEN